MYDTSDIRKNLKIILDDQPFVVVDFQFVKPGKGGAFTRTRLKNMITGSVIERTFKSGTKLTPAVTEEEPMQYLYQSGSQHFFMNLNSYDQTVLNDEQLGDAKNWLKENLECTILIFQEKPVGINLPNFVDLKVVKADPGLKGDTASGATKPVDLETGAVVHVPLFVEEGTTIRIDTRTGSYVTRV